MNKYDFIKTIIQLIDEELIEYDNLTDDDIIRAFNAVNKFYIDKKINFNYVELNKNSIYIEHNKKLRVNVGDNWVSIEEQENE